VLAQAKNYGWLYRLECSFKHVPIESHIKNSFERIPRQLHTPKRYLGNIRRVLLIWTKAINQDALHGRNYRRDSAEGHGGHN